MHLSFRSARRRVRPVLATKAHRLMFLAACVVGALVTAVAVAATGPSPDSRRVTGAPARAADPPCFGAAARDPARPCRNPALRLSVTPAPDVAARSPNAPCRAFEQHGLVRLCYF